MIVTRTPSYTLQKIKGTKKRQQRKGDKWNISSQPFKSFSYWEPSQLVIYILTTSEFLTGSNLQGTPQRYRAVLANNQCYLTEAMRQFSIARNTLRDYLGICELQIIDAEKYKRVVKAEREKIAKVSVKCIELCCRAVLNKYRVLDNKLKLQLRLHPLKSKTPTRNMHRI